MGLHRSQTLEGCLLAEGDLIMLMQQEGGGAEQVLLGAIAAPRSPHHCRVMLKLTTPQERSVINCSAEHNELRRTVLWRTWFRVCFHEWLSGVISCWVQAVPQEAGALLEWIRSHPQIMSQLRGGFNPPLLQAVE